MESLKELGEWPQPVIELLGFIAEFLAIGAVGFRNVVLRSATMRMNLDAAPTLRRAAHRAAALGLIGIALSAILLAIELPGTAAERHTTVGQLLRTNRVLEVQIAMLVVALA